MNWSRFHTAILLLVISSGLLSPISSAQEMGTLAGTIVDRETGIHLPSTLLLFENANLVFVADSMGDFSIRLSPKERARLLVQRPGYHPLELLVTLIAGQQLFLPIELEPRGHDLMNFSQGADSNKISRGESAVISAKATQCSHGHGVLAGNVFDQASGEPVAGVCIFVRGTSISTITDSTGHFHFTLPSDTLYTIAVSQEGYEKDWYSVAVDDEALVEVQLQLWQGQLSEDATTMAEGIQNRDPGTPFTGEGDIESLAPLNFKDMLYSLFPDLLYVAARPTTFNRPAYFLYVDGIRWNTRFLNHIDPFAIRAIAVWEGRSAPSRFSTGIAIYVVGVTTYQ